MCAARLSLSKGEKQADSKKEHKRMIDIQEFYHAQEVLKPILRTTNLLHTPKLSTLGDIYLKPECLQKTGSFKLRGACYRISQLSAEEKARGVVACSAGNHAQGVALGASTMGIKSLICLPEGAPISKVEATRRLGAEICLVSGVYDDAYARALQLRNDKGYAFVHPFDDKDVIIGQGTIGIEILEQLPEVQAVVVPVGGGGLISGVAVAMKALNPAINVFGVQAAGAASMVESLCHHQREQLSHISTIADGLAVKMPGALTFDICSRYVDDIVTVDEEEICSAILRLLEEEKMVAEGAGAASVAAVMFDKLPIRGMKTVCIVSGGNIDVNILNRVINRGLAKDGRLCHIELELPDKPGSLVKVANVIARMGGNVLAVHHDRTSSRSDVTACVLHVTVETRNAAHVEKIKETLRQEGLPTI